jgi:methionyl-tRNA formyltransferase
MNTTPRFSVVTGSTIESGTTIAYLIETTGVRIETIYYDTMQLRSRKTTPPAAAPKPRWYSSWRAFRTHLALACSMPRHYGFKALGKAFGITQMGFLYRLERIAPTLLPWMCGFPLPLRPAQKPLLRKLDDVAREYGIPLVKTPSLNSDETVMALRDQSPDVVIGLGTRILSARLLETARIGFLNAHSSLLPEYRGGGTEFWQLAGGERRTGVTIHWMASKVDEGPVCAQKSWAIPRGFNHHRLRLLSFFNRLPLWQEVIERLLVGEVPRLPQRTGRTPTFKAPTEDQQYEYYRRGVRPAG